MPIMTYDELIRARILIKVMVDANLYMAEHSQDLDERLMDVENPICHLYTVYREHLPKIIIEEIEELKARQRAVKQLYDKLREELVREEEGIAAEIEALKLEAEAKGIDI